MTRAGGGEWGACRECSGRSNELRSRQVRKSSSDFPAGGENRGRDLWHPLGEKGAVHPASKGSEVAPPAAFSPPEVLAQELQLQSVDQGRGDSGRIGTD